MIEKKEIKDDFYRFLRHEAMRANCQQDDVLNIIKEEINGNLLQ